MKNSTLLLAVIILTIINAKAQIPNSGFENWTVGNPDGWVTCNGGGGTGNPITQSSDHYPLNAGNSSIRLENFAAGATGCATYGFANTALYLGYNGPTFPVTGHPTSFCGYYKFFQANNDTMNIGLALYKNGVMVAGAQIIGITTVSNWTSFNIPISSYSLVDSASIGISAFYAEPGIFPAGPWGNSVLYVDNLSYDNLITSTVEQDNKNTFFNLYPNPAKDIITINFENILTTDLTLNVYNLIGKLNYTDLFYKDQHQINFGNLANGIYIVELQSKEWTAKQKLIIQR